MADAIGAISLALQLFDCAATGYKIFASASSFGNDSLRLEWKFRVQHCRFLQWGEKVGLSRLQHNGDEDGSVDDHIAAAEVISLVTTSLGLIQQSLDRATKIVAVYEMAATGPANSPTLQRIENMSGLQSALSSLADEGRKQTEKAAARTKVTSYRKKLKWAVRDKDEFDGLVRILKEYNDGLYSVLPPKQQISLDYALPLGILYSNDRIVLNAIEEAASEDGYVQLSRTAAFRQKKASASLDEPRGISLGRPIAPAALQLDKASYQLLRKLDEGSDDRQIWTTVQNSRAPASGDTNGPGLLLVEWREIPRPADFRTKIILANRIVSVAQLLHSSAIRPKGFETLDCLGYFEDRIEAQERLGLVYKLTSSSYIFLNELLVKPGLPPFLGLRFQLARSLAQALSVIHASGWVHKAIRSQNVIFQPTTTGALSNPSMAWLSSPKFTCFHFSRPDHPLEHTEKALEATHNLYRHPDCQGPVSGRFKAVYDIYSLGILLLEIGLWRSVASLWKSRYSPEVFKGKLVGIYCQELGWRMGEEYQEVVKRCLNGNFGLDGEEYGGGDGHDRGDQEAENGTNAAKLQRAFYRYVLVKLDHCRA